MKRPQTYFSHYPWVQLVSLIERVKDTAAKSKVEAADPQNVRIMQDVQAEMAYLIYALKEGITTEAIRYLDAPVKSYKLSPPIPEPPVLGTISNVGVKHDKSSMLLTFRGEKGDTLLHEPQELALITYAYWFSTTQHTTD